MTITASKLRENVYRLVDQVIETGVPIEIERKGEIVKLVSEKSSVKLRRLEDLPKRDIIVGDPDELIHIDWSSEWSSEPL